VINGGYVPVAEVVRSGAVEGVHFGAVVVLGPDGEIASALGDPHQVMYPRSAAKPMQAAGMLRLGLELPDDLLALVCASHSGEPVHVDGVRRILAGCGLGESALQNTPRLPGYRPAAREVVRAGGAEASVYADCSGKHAGMLATCVSNGWPTQTYLEPTHPLQAALRSAFEESVGEPSGHVGVDGCGAPIWTCTLTGLARAFRAAVTLPSGHPLRVAADAMRRHPELVGGTDRDVTGFMRAVPGLLAKEGAEGVYAAALPDGSAVALTVSDGAHRAAQPALAAALVRAGVDPAAVAHLATVPVLGHGVPVGEVHAV
jgi:L-asparaginase II